MSIENLDLIAQHEVSTRWHARLEALGLLAVIVIVVTAILISV